MFGHNALSNKIPFNMLNAEFITFRAGTEAAFDYEGDVYIITPGDGNYAKLIKPEGATGVNPQSWGSQDGSVSDAVASAINAIPSGSYYRIEGYTDPSVTNSPTEAASLPADDDDDDAGDGNGEDEETDTIATDDTNWLLYGGLALAGILGFSMLR